MLLNMLHQNLISSMMGKYLIPLLVLHTLLAASNPVGLSHAGNWTINSRHTDTISTYRYQIVCNGDITTLLNTCSGINYYPAKCTTDCTCDCNGNMKCQNLGTGQDCDGDGTSYICGQGDGGPACGCTLVDQKGAKVRRDDGRGEIYDDEMHSNPAGGDKEKIASPTREDDAAQTTAISGPPGPTCTGTPNAAASEKFPGRSSMALLGTVIGLLTLAGV